MSLLRVEDISKQFGREQVLKNCSLEVASREILSVLGRSGSGKTTLLKIIAGLERADAGTVALDGQSVDSIPAHRREMVYLYQEALLFPHLSVWENIAFGLRLRKQSESDIRHRTDRMLLDLDLTEHARKAPEQLSGGQRQRVAFGRALVINPRVLLLDEPFGALDSETRTDMQALYLRISKQYQMTTILVTHDLKEAVRMGDRLAVMESGQLRHYASRNEFIADARTGVQREMAFWQQFRSDLSAESD